MTEMFPKQAFKFARTGVSIQHGTGHSCHYYQLQPGNQTMPIKSKKFTYMPLDAIAYNSAAYFAGYHQPQPTFCRRFNLNIAHKQASPQFFTL